MTVGQPQRDQGSTEINPGCTCARWRKVVSQAPSSQALSRLAALALFRVPFFFPVGHFSSAWLSFLSILFLDFLLILSGCFSDDAHMIYIDDADACSGEISLL
jgi:hypothetical protein